MAGFGILKVACVMLILCMMVVAPPRAEAVVTCGLVVSSLRPCLPYLKGGGVVPPPCCGGIKSLLGAAKTTADRQTACKCLKSASGGVNPGFAASLPGKCGVSIPYKISPSTDCNSVK